MTIHSDPTDLLRDVLTQMSKATPEYECHSCGLYHSHVVEMVDPYDPESRGEYCSNCIPQKRKDGWRAT